MRKKIGELLIEAGSVTEEQVRTALGQQKAVGKARRLGEVLVAMGFTTQREVAQALARQFDLPFVELAEVPPAVSSLVPMEFQRRHRVVPFRSEREGRTQWLSVAVDDPTTLARVDELRTRLRCSIRVHVAAADDVDGALAPARSEPLEILDTSPSSEDDGGVDLIIDHGNEHGDSDAEADRWLEQAVEDLSPMELTPEPPTPPVARLGPPTPIRALTPTAVAAVMPKPSPATARAAPSPARVPRSVPPPPPPAEAEAEDVSDLSIKNEDLLDELMGGPPAKPPPPPPSESKPKAKAAAKDKALPKGKDVPKPAASPAKAPPNPRVPVVVFGGAAQDVPPPEPPPAPDFSEDDLQVLENLERLAQGDDALQDTEKVRPARMIASLIRLLIRKRVISELEFLDELSRK